MLSNSAELFHASQPIFAGRLPETIATDTSIAPTKLPERFRGGLSPRALRRVRDYVEVHLDETISLDVLAGIAGLSMYHFARAFKQSEGVTPHEYIVHRRVRHGLELLADTDLPLSEIALALGFSDQSHFARRFREHVGVTPSSYRWSMR